MALLVVLFHVWQFMANRGWPSFSDLAILRKGTEGVYVFFSLSGFLIIRNLFLEKKTTGKVSIGNFYRRRVLRIFPLYYAILIFGFLYYNLLLPRLGFNVESATYDITKGILLGGTFFSNILATYKPGGILEILWSIGIEEQFYLFVAPLFLLLPIKRLTLFFLLFTLVYFSIFHLDSFRIFQDYRMYFYFFSASGLVAILSIKYPDYKVGNVFRYTIFGLVLIYFFTDFFVVRLSDVFYQLFSTVLFPVFIYVMIQKPYGFFQNTTLKYFGKISYGIYMLHPIVMQMVGFLFLKLNDQLFYDHGWSLIIAFNLLTILLTLLLAHWSYKYFESYFLKYK